MQCQSKLPYSAVFFCFLLFFTVAPALADNQESEFTMGGVFSLLLKSSHTSTLLPALQGGHEAILEWNGTSTCLACHMEEAQQVFASSHYQWLGETPYMTNGPNLQGKLDLGVNSYCINITGNWNGCGACHVGLGLRPDVTQSMTQLENIDCLICHQQEYKRIKVNGVFVADEANMSISMVKAAQTVHLPTRATCVQCHAKGVVVVIISNEVIWLWPMQTRKTAPLTSTWQQVVQI